MPQPFKQWTVLPHGKLRQIEENILTVVDTLQMPVVEPQRRMTVIRLNDGRLVIFSAIALDDDEMHALEAWGSPTFLIVPNAHHRMDARPWFERYPSMMVVAPQGARQAVEEVVPVHSVMPQFEDPNLEYIVVPGTRQREVALLHRSPRGATLVLNDVVDNIRGEGGFGGWVLRLAGFAGDDAQVPRVVRAAMVHDKHALRVQLQAWSHIDALRRVLVPHGDPIEDKPRQTLRELAAALH